MTNNQEPKKNVILFVDDHKICHDLIAMVIPNFEGYRVVSAYSGKEAIKLAQQYAHDIALVLCDVMLPDLKVIDIYQVCQGDDSLKEVPFILQSGLPLENQDIMRYLPLDVDVIHKPYSKDDLFNILSQILEA